MLFRPIVFFLVLLCAASLARGQAGDRSEIDKSDPPEEWEIPPAPVLSPQQALESFTVKPGFRVELVASEPLIHDPVAIDFDEDGRIWVVEMRSYMPNVDGEGEIVPVSRVVVLEDTTGDGKMDTSTVYLDELILPRAIKVVAGGVLIAEPPNLWFTRDTNGDGRADEKTLVADDYSHREANPEHGGNSLTVGLDNWVHSAMHDGGRYRFLDGEWVREPALLRGQWGLSQDNYGRHFTNSNSDHLRADLVPNHYYTRNRNFPARRGIIPGSMGGVYERVAHDQTTWPARITPGVNRRVQLRDDGTLRRFTAACGPVIYRGDQFPEEYYGNAFIAEPAAHFIRRSLITEDEGGILDAENAYEEAEFLNSTDERFRPVNLYTGPDGAMYIVDMYRGVLQHRQFVTTYLRKQVEDRGLEEPVALGRIYRVVHESEEPGEWPRMSSESAREIVAHLAHPNGWWRDTAQRVLVDRGDEAAVPALRDMAVNHENHLARIHALWTLEGLGGLDLDLLEEALGDPEPWVAAHAIRVSEPWLRDNESRAVALVAGMAGNGAPRQVELQAALSLGEARGTEAEAAMADLLQRRADRPFMVEAVLSGLEGRELEFIAHIMDDASWSERRDGYERVVSAFAAAVMREGASPRIDALFDAIADEAERPQWQRLAVIAGMDQSGVRNLDTEPVALTGLLVSEDDDVRRAAAELAGKFEWPDPDEDAAEPAELSEDMQALVDAGRQQYMVACAACHQRDGMGMAGLAPGLVDSEWVTGDKEPLVKIVLHGLEGDELIMPPMHALEDDALAAILTYIRRSWGHRAEPVTAGQVAEIRTISAERDEVWTREALEEAFR